MRHLYLLRGAPGAGKSTLINTYNLQNFTLSADVIRQMYSNATYKLVKRDDGSQYVKENINADHEGKVWETLIEMLEARMSRGETTIIDATHSNNDLISAYNKLVEKYRYRTFTIQLDVPLETLIANNNKRVEVKRVPEHSIIRKYGELEDTTEKLSKRYGLQRFDNIHDAGEFILANSTWNTRVIDPTKYENVYVIGDIHASYDTLKVFLDEHYDANNYYVFIGDYLDRGLKPYETVNALHDLVGKHNVVFLRGNHETNYENWLQMPRKYTEEEIKANRISEAKVTQRRDEHKHYKKLTRSSTKYINELRGNTTEAEFTDFTDKLKKILSHIQDIYLFSVNGVTYVCTHGGIISNVLDFNGTGSMINFSTDMMVRGFGTYDDDIDAIFTQQMMDLPEDERVIQIHGHRNTYKHGVLDNQYSYNVEQGISDGGSLGVLAVNVQTGEATDLSVKNTNYRMTLRNTDIENYPVSKFLEDARQDKYIRVKPLKTVEDVFSVNFTEKAFYDNVWSDMTVRARGLFINPYTEQVVARSYDKFFNMNQRPETNFRNLEDTLVYPVTISSKTNGFLGIMTVYRGEFLFLSKSTDASSFSKLFKDTFMEHTSKLGVNLEELKAYIEQNNVTLVFEVIDNEKDPHIINYEQKGVVLLDVFKNQLKEETVDVKGVPELNKFVRPEELVLTNWGDFKKFVGGFNRGVDMRTNPTVKGLGESIDKYNEGLVIKDATNFRVKVKGAFYNTWKGVRPIIHRCMSGKQVQTRNKIDREFVAYIKEERTRDLTYNILEERARYVEYMKNRYGVTN